MQLIRQWILTTAKKLNRSTRYKHAKKYINEILNNPENPLKKYIDLMMMFFIISSVGILVYEVQHAVPEWMDIYDIYFVSTVFLIEYLLRLWVHTDLYRMVIDAYKRAHILEIEFSLRVPMIKAIRESVKYMLTPAMIIDFLAILPAYRELRILRVFVLFRVFKLLRYTKSINQFMEVLRNKRFELLTLLFLLMFVMMTAGIAIYIFEEHLNPQINSLFDALYWALVTIATVGYGDISPVTHEGRIVSMIIIVTGIAMISFATSVIVSAFSEKLIQLKESRIIEQVNKSESFLLICGYGQMTKMFMRQREKRDYEYVILEKDKDKYNQAIKDGYDAVREDASRHDTLAKFNVEYSKITILCLLNSDIENIYISLNAKSISRDMRVIARASDSSMVQKFKRAGVDQVLLPNSVANRMMQMAIIKPHLYKAAHAILTGKEVAVFDEIRLYPEDALIGKRVEEINFKKMRLLLMAIEKAEDREFLCNPSGDTVLKSGDVLVLMGYRIGLEYFKEFYHESVK
jgi:voltage-gated potassium channel